MFADKDILIVAHEGGWLIIYDAKDIGVQKKIIDLKHPVKCMKLSNNKSKLIVFVEV